MLETAKNPVKRPFPATLTPRAEAGIRAEIVNRGTMFDTRAGAGGTAKASETIVEGVCPCCGATLKNQQPRVDLNSNHLVFRGRTVALSPKQAELMESLLRRAPGVVAHDTLVRHLWGRDEPADPAKNIQVHVHRLRRVLAPLGISIINVLEVGYRVAIEEGAQ